MTKKPKRARRTNKTKADLLELMSKLGACEEATNFVREHPSNSAEVIGRDALKVRPYWVDWFHCMRLSYRAWGTYLKQTKEANGGLTVWGDHLKKTKVKVVIGQYYRKWCRS